MNPPLKPTPRKYLRVSLRSLLVLVLIIAAWLGWLVHSARVQRDAVAAIQKREGTARYDWERKDGRNIPNGEPWLPKWLVQQIGIDFAGHVTQVRVVAAHDLTEADLIHISDLSQLEELDLHRSPITDASLAHLNRLTNLQSLVLFHTPITDAGLEHLKKLRRLRKLSIEDTNVTDDGVFDLQTALPNLIISR